MWAGIGALAVATGPSFGATLITWFGWRSAFYVNLPVGLVAWLVGRRVLDRSHGSEDAIGSRLSRSGDAERCASRHWCSAISEGPTWGWSSGWIVASFVGAVALGALFLRRSARHAEPVLDLSSVRGTVVHRGQCRNAALRHGFLRHAARQHPVPHECLALLDPRSGSRGHTGPSRRGGRVRACRPTGGDVRIPKGAARRVRRVRIGSRVVRDDGWDSSRDYLSIWLPGTLVIGLGIGLTFPVLGAAAVSSLHHQRFAVGSAVNQTARQVGGATRCCLAGGDPRHAEERGRCAGELSPPVVVRRSDGGVVGLCLFASSAAEVSSRANRNARSSSYSTQPSPLFAHDKLEESA